MELVGTAERQLPADADALSVAKRMHASNINYSIIDDLALKSIAEFGVWPGFP